jgi:hypothetical protein
MAGEPPERDFFREGEEGGSCQDKFGEAGIVV